MLFRPRRNQIALWRLQSIIEKQGCRIAHFAGDQIPENESLQIKRMLSPVQNDLQHQFAAEIG